MRINTNIQQAFVSVESIVKAVMDAQENDGKIDLSEGINIAVSALDEIAKVFTDEEGKLNSVVESLKGMFSQLAGYLRDGKVSRFEIMLLSIKLVQLITDIVELLK